MTTALATKTATLVLQLRDLNKTFKSLPSELQQLLDVAQRLELLATRRGENLKLNKDDKIQEKLQQAIDDAVSFVNSLQTELQNRNGIKGALKNSYDFFGTVFGYGAAKKVATIQGIIASLQNELLFVDSENQLYATENASKLLASESQKLNSLQQITNEQARAFWLTHFGKENNSIPWETFVNATKLELKKANQVIYLQSIDRFYFKLRDDIAGKDRMIDVYEFNDLSEVHGYPEGLIQKLKLINETSGMGSTQLLLWLQELNLSADYSGEFLEQKVTFDLLVSLTDAELNELLKEEIKMRVIDRKKVTESILAWKKEVQKVTDEITSTLPPTIDLVQLEAKLRIREQQIIARENELWRKLQEFQLEKEKLQSEKLEKVKQSTSENNVVKISTNDHNNDNSFSDSKGKSENDARGLLLEILALEILILEKYVKFQAHNPSWPSQRIPWEARLSTKNIGLNEIAETLITFEESIQPKSFTKEWKDTRSEWKRRLEATENINELIGLLLQLQRSIDMKHKTWSKLNLQPWERSLNCIIMLGAAISTGSLDGQFVVNSAINQGAPLFNSGHPDLCADLYQKFLNFLLPFAHSLSLSTENITKIQNSNITAASPDPKIRAWALRQILNEVLASLAK